VGDAGDPAPLDPDICGDSDGDTCDDCSIGFDGYGPFPDNTPSNDGDDFDGDGLCDAGDPDDDNDGVDDVLDSDPFNPFECRDADGDTCDDCSSGTDDPENDGDDNDEDGLCDDGDEDDDNDTIPDDIDNCPFKSNVFQFDGDGDGIGDVCDDCQDDPFNDYDEDLLCASEDNCPSVPNPNQQDQDNDGIGDACEIVTVAGLFRISATEVTNAEYAVFLNAVAALDPNRLYNSQMLSSARGGIRRLGFGGSYFYPLKSNMGNKPVNFVSWLDAARYANWLHNGKPTGAQGPATTETGAYDLTVASPGESAVRSSAATWFLPTKAEWDLAAYTQPPATTWLFPTRSDLSPTGATADAQGNVSNPGINIVNYNETADWNLQNGNVTSVGSCGPVSTSYWGTYDQGGNVAEWSESLKDTRRRIRGGSFKSAVQDLRQAFDASTSADVERADLGFRIGSTLPLPTSPEPDEPNP